MCERIRGSHDDVLYKSMYTLLYFALDMSAAFDTVSHQKLLDTLNSQFGEAGTALNWHRSYLAGRTYCVIANNIESGIVKLDCGLCIATRFFTWAVEENNLRCRATGDRHSTLHLFPWIRRLLTNQLKHGRL